ncbi:hypothetical protein CRG98_009921 [Punica granatum]|uniref:Reverse transcriptase domain-containing protein n=1 Tax=Punica granatum TaxID=22663 RepID=A0A2I0KMT4_PUNGR|nr:hypothetical protein CRG98_009921 [Punica granatum]
MPDDLPTVYAVTEEIPSEVHICLALHSNPNLRRDDSNPSEECLVEPGPIYFGEGLYEDNRVPEIEESLRRLEDRQLTSVEPTKEINVGTKEDPRILKIGTGLDPTQRARMIDFVTRYQEVFAWSFDSQAFPPARHGEVPAQTAATAATTCRSSPPHQRGARHTQFSFMDGFSEYNQIRMAKEDKIKTMFTMMWGTICYRVMPFGLKNTEATYQRAMVTLFHDMIHKEIEVYVDDMIAKSKEGEDHLVNLKRLFDRLREYKLRLNPAKCTFGAKSEKLLGFVVSECGIEVDPDKVKAIIELPPPSSICEVRGFLRRLNYITRFIANLTDKCQPLFCLATDAKPWYEDIKNFLQTGQYPPFADRRDRKTLRRLAIHYFLSGETLYRRSFDATLLRCIDENEARRLMEEVHGGSC